MSAILNQLNENLKGLSNSNIVSIDSIDKLVLNLDGKLSGVNFHYEFDLNLLDSSLIRDHVILPLLFNCSEYQARESQLVKIINDKDKELDDYRSQGVKLTRSKTCIHCHIEYNFMVFCYLNE